MLLPLVGVVLAGVPPNWLAWPVAADLHPVGWNYGVRYQAVLEETVGGRRASAAFSPIVAAADVHWRLVASTGTGIWLDEDAPTVWRDAALSAALVSVSRIADETVARAPTVDAFYTVFDTVLNPSLRLQKQPSGGFVPIHRPGGRLANDLDRAETEIGADRRRLPSLAVGFDWRFRDADDPPRTPFLDYGAFLSLSEVLLSSLRVDVLALAGQWRVTARQRVYPGVYLLGTARSADDPDTSGVPRDWLTAAAPSRWTAGVLWNVPPDEDWTVRFERVTTLADGAVTWQVSLRAEFGAFAPGRVRPALGARDPTDAWLPDVPERDPLRLTSVVATPAEPTSGGSGARRSPGRR